jgi:transcriptional regulator with XRE-family HTH domain
MKNEEIVIKVRETRKMRGLTQADIAQVLDKTSSTVSDIERGKIQISATDLYKISILLNKPIEYFYGDEFNDETQELIFLIRSQPKEYQEKIFQQVKMFLSLNAFQKMVNDPNQELSEKEMVDVIQYVFQYADDIEKIHIQMTEIKENLREIFKSQGIDEKNLLQK